jgi:soluble lytic murein transglycosylase-like protein
VLRAALTIVVLAVVLTGCGGDSRSAPGQAEAPTPTPVASATPGPDGPLPSGAEALAGELVRERDALYAAVDEWRSSGDPGSGAPPEAVAVHAVREQRIYRLLGRRASLARGVLRALPARLRSEARDNVLARSELSRIVSVRNGPPPRIAIARAEPADSLRGYYRRAWRRFRVGPPLLAAVNFVESGFGRLRNRSISGARGPMQFMPATWAAYGLGGDISSPRDAILGAAHYLRANGAPGDEARALHHYNPSLHYVRAIRAYARRIRADRRRFYAYYAWAVYIGDERRTGPGRRTP